MKKLFFILLLAILIVGGWITYLKRPDLFYSPKLTIYTEEFPPYNFTDSGDVTGLSTEIVTKILEDAGYDFEIKSLPWSVSYQKVQEEENAFIFSMSRNVKRQKLFKWVGVIAKSSYSVYALKNRPEIIIRRLIDLKRYKIGTTMDDAREAYLLNNGFTLDDFIRVGGDSSNLVNFNKLKEREIDVWSMPDAVLYYILKKEGYDPDAIVKKVFPLESLTGGYYLASSLSTSSAIVKRIRTKLSEFKKTDEYRDIKMKWGL